MSAIGYAALVLAAALSFTCAANLFLGQQERTRHSTLMAENGLIVVAGLVSLSTSILLFLLLSRDFQVKYVYSYASTYQPTPYVISALWAGQEGSLLLWLFFVCAITVFMIARRHTWPAELWPHMLTILAIVQVFFAFMLVTVQNPFASMPGNLTEGAGMLPVLENPGMVLHPPILFLGYAACVVPFAFAFAGLASGRFERGWLSTVRRYSLVAWLLLGLGILIGAWWAYVELGWGGYWAWDPVENASLLPWLVSTAYLHGVMAQERNGMFKRWNAALAVTAFVLCIFGTLVTRGGIVVSDLHGFSRSVQPVAFYLIGFILAALALLGALLLRQRRQLQDDVSLEELLSRESGLFLTNLLLVGLAAAVLVGILFPNIAQALRGVQVQLGASFYNRIFAPLALAIVLLLAVCPLLGWRSTETARVKAFLARAMLPALVIAGLLLAFGLREPVALLSFAVVALAASSNIGDIVRQALVRSHARGESLFASFRGLIMANRRRYGATLVHFSILLMAVAVTGSSLFKLESQAQLAVGEVTTIQGYALRYEGLSVRDEPGKVRYIANLGVYRGTSRVGDLRPEKDYYASTQDYATEVAIRTTWQSDLYVALDWVDESDRVNLRVSLHPLMLWLWVGGGLLLAGTVFGIWPSRPLASIEPTTERPASLPVQAPQTQVRAKRRKRRK